MKVSGAVLVALALMSGASRADESLIQLKDMPGRDAVLTHCSTCHSLDYIQMNSPFLDRRQWEAEVNKMVNAFKAPIPQEEISRLVDYLANAYGKP